MNDLISRDALIQHAYSAVVDGVEKDIIDLSDVDNAPTVETIPKVVRMSDAEAIKFLSDTVDIFYNSKKQFVAPLQITVDDVTVKYLKMAIEALKKGGSNDNN